MVWSIQAVRIVIWLSLAFGAILATAAVAPPPLHRTINLQTLPRLLSLHEPAPNVTSVSDVGIRNNATVYVAIPPVSMDQQLYVTINVCSLSSSTQYPIVLISNGTSLSTTSDAGDQASLSPWDETYLSADSKLDRSSGFPDKTNANHVREVLRGQYVWDIKLEGNAGFANWTGWMGDGGVIGIFADQGDSIDAEVGLRVGAPLHAVAPDLPLLGDTTDTQALIMSPVLEPLDEYRDVPYYPNYTLFSPFPQKVDVPDVDARPLYQARPMYPIMLETASWAAAGGPTLLSASMCAIYRRLNETTDLTGFTDILRDNSRTEVFETSTAQATASFVQRPAGWRWDWIVQGLVPDATNYTAWIVEPGDSPSRGTIHGPINLVTKEATFPCPLVHGLGLCPSIAYAAPLNVSSDKPYPIVTSLESHLEDVLSASLNGFSTSLLSSACGRDLFSPVSTCADCFDEYREWLCRSILPRCASRAQVDASDGRTQMMANEQYKGDAIPMTTRRALGNPRTPFSAQPTYPYEELLPCLDNCRRVDRKCPVFLEFRCPLRGITANQSYAYCGPDKEDRGRCEGETDGGADLWGNIWCNGFQL